MEYYEGRFVWGCEIGRLIDQRRLSPSSVVSLAKLALYEDHRTDPIRTEVNSAFQNQGVTLDYLLTDLLRALVDYGRKKARELPRYQQAVDQSLMGLFYGPTGFPPWGDISLR